MVLLGDLAVKIGANTAELKKGLKESKDSVNKFAKNTKSGGKSIQSSFGKIGGSVKGMASNMTGQLGIAGQALNTLGGSFTSIIGGLKGATSGLKIFKVALASTGIGLLVIGLGSLVAYFTKTQKGADFISKALAGVGAVVDVVIDTVAAFGGAIFEAVTNPQKALKAFGSAIKNFVLARFEQLIGGIKGIGTAFKLLFEGKFQDAAKTAGTALKDIVMSTTPVGLAMSVVSENLDIVKKKYGEASSEARKAMQLEEEAIQLEKDKIAQKLRNSELEIQLSELIRKSKDKEKYGEAERLAFIEKSIGIQKTLSNEKIALAQEELRIKKESDKLANNMRSDDEATIDLQIEVNKLMKQANDKERELLNRVSEATNAKNAQAKVQAEINRLNREEAQIAKDMANVPALEKKTTMGITVDDEGLNELQATVNRLGSQIKPINVYLKPQIKVEEARVKMLELKDNVVKAANGISEGISTVTNGIGAAFSSMMNKQNAELDNHYAKERGLIESSEMSARQKAAAIQKLEEETQAKRAKLQKKQAKMDKATALVGAIISTAQAVAKALTAGPLIGQILAGVTAGLGAIQVATIASTPIPTFNFGGIVEGATEGDRNLIRANGGEMVLNKGQQSKMFDVINKGVAGAGGGGNIHITGRLIGSGDELVAVVDSARQKQNNTF